MRLLLLLLTIFASTQSYANLKCNFGIYGAPIISTSTKLDDKLQLGELTRVAYQGSPSKLVKNVLLALKDGELYHFELDEGLPTNRIYIIVYNRKNADNTFISFIENPQSEYYKKMDGVCSIGDNL